MSQNILILDFPILKTRLQLIYIFLRYCPPTSYKSMCDLSQRTIFYRFHQVLQTDFHCLWQLPLISPTHFSLFDSFRFQKACSVCICSSFSSVVLRITSLGNNGRASFFIQKSIYTNEWKFTGMFLMFVIQTFFLYLIALVHSFHSTQAHRLVQ